MKGSLRIGTVGGTGVFLHWSFLALFGWLFLSQAVGSGLPAALQMALFVSAVFLCVTLHEIGHATMARRFGIGTQDITLLPIGGVARLDRIPEEPRKELLIALAGPVVNVVIAASLYVGMKISGMTVLTAEGTMTEGSILTSLFWFNVIIVAFNMLPAFPMDGGRVFRALLARRRDYVEATQTAAQVGQAIAVVFVVLGAMSNWMLVVVGLFVMLGAAAESKAVEVRALAAEASAADAMMSNFHILTGHQSLRDAASTLLEGSQSDFPVLLSNGQTGLLTRSTLLSELKSRGPAATLDDVVQTPASRVSSGESLERSMESMAVTRGPVLVVNSLQETIGLLTPDNVQEWLVVKRALNASTKLKTRRAGSDLKSSRCPALHEPLIRELSEHDRFTLPSV